MNTSTSVASTVQDEAQRFTMAMLVWLKPTGPALMAEFRDRAAPLFAKYDLRLERQLAITGKGQIVGENPFEQPDIIQMVSFPSVERFKAYVGDPQYVEFAKLRDNGIRRMTVMAGLPMDIGWLSTPGSGPAHTRFYGVGLVRFLQDGEKGMDAFNEQAQGLFARHGMHLETVLKIGQIMTPLGEADGMSPQRIVVFFLDQASALKGYAADPEYLALAPLRDAGLETYDLFFGMVPSMAEASTAPEMGR